LYGSASGGGVWGNGTLFAINTDGTGFTNLHNFTGPRLARFNLAITNTDGANPSALVLCHNTLYGTASSGGGYGNGTVFAIKADGSSFTNLHDFTPISDAAHFFTNSDGSNPQAGLIVSGNTLYGTAAQGGSNWGWDSVQAKYGWHGFHNHLQFQRIFK
jgi:uncharacterized repeat protein (TIGR03803 family)